MGVRGQEPRSSAAAPLDFESLIGWLNCPGLGEADAAALDMLESCAKEGPLRCAVMEARRADVAE